MIINHSFLLVPTLNRGGFSPMTINVIFPDNKRKKERTFLNVPGMLEKESARRQDELLAITLFGPTYSC